MSALEGDAVFEDGDFVVAVLLVVRLGAVSNFDDELGETFSNLLHRFALCDDTGIEVNPIRLVVIQVRIGGDLHRRYIRAKGRAATGREEDHMTSAGSECRRSDEVVTRSREQVESLYLQALAIRHHAAYKRLTAFLRAAERFVLERRDTSGFVARTRVLAYRLAVTQEIVLEIPFGRRGPCWHNDP